MYYGIVYRITCSETDKSYIGRTKRSLRQRWYDHCHVGSNCVYLKRAIEKYGKDSFTIQVIASSWDKESLKELESLLIQQENTLVPNGYNLINTQGGVSEISDETREKLKAGWNAYWGRDGSREHKSQVMKTLWKDPEYRQRLTEKRKLAAQKPERRRAHSKFMIGKQFSLGRKQSEAERKMRSAVLKKVNLRIHGITFNGETMTMTDWAARIGINHVTLWHRIDRWGVERALTTPARKDSRRGKSRASP